MSLPVIAVTGHYAVAGHRAWNDRRRTQSVRTALLCLALVRFFTLSLRRSGTRTLDTGILTFFEPRSVDEGRSTRRRTERSLQDRTLDGVKIALLRTGRSKEDESLDAVWNGRRRIDCLTEDGVLDAGLEN